MAHEVELTQLDLRYEDYRLKQAAVEARLLASIAQRGVEEPLEGVEIEQAKVLLNGFKRYRCARKLRLPTVPYASLGGDEVTGILGLLRTAKNKSLSILEQARFIDELKNVRRLSVAEIATELSVSKAWVSMRLGLLGEMSPTVCQKLFSGAFPVYPYMYTLRQFMRMNGVKKQEVEQFVVAVSGKDLSVRDIEQLAHGFFRGPASFRQEILQGNVALPLRQMQQVPPDTDGCSEFERVLLSDLEVLQKYMQRVMGKSQDPRLQSRVFHAQSHLLTGGVLSRATAFIHTLRQLHDRNGQAQSDLPAPPGRHGPAGDRPAAGDQPQHRANGDPTAGPSAPRHPQGQASDRSGSAPATAPGVCGPGSTHA
jgi:hypothetical protein